MLRVRLLGGLALERDGEPIAPPPSRRSRLLAGWLALHPGLHAREALAGRLRPDVLDDSAR
jgi:DNA-binding SARP family transcriptional activator